MYTASVYSLLTSIISGISSATLLGKRIGVFSYGSGLAASVFSIKVVGDVSHIAKALNLKQLLDDRIKVSPEEHEQVMSEFISDAYETDAETSRGFEGAGKGICPQGSME